MPSPSVRSTTSADLMREVAEAHVDGFVRRGKVDIVDEFTDRYPMEVLCRVLGVPPTDGPRFVDAAHDLHLMASVPMAPGFERIDQALRTLEEYVLEILDRRRLDPADDYITGLVEAQRTEGTLTRSELVGNVINLLFAGAGTTRYQLASTVRALVDNGVWEIVAADPRLISSAIEEALRFYPVTQFVVRIPDDDVVIGPHLFPARRRVILNLQAASRDPARFTEPDRFDIARPNLLRSRLPFGWGTHHCLGHALSRAAMAEAIAVLARRLTGVSLAEEVTPSPPGAMLGGPEHLSLTFAARGREFLEATDPRGKTCQPEKHSSQQSSITTRSCRGRLCPISRRSIACGHSTVRFGRALRRVSG